MSCQRCQSERLAGISARRSDLCFADVGSNETHGYVPGDMGVGGGDYVDISYCMDCGQMQGTFPLPPCKLEIGS